MTLITLIVRDTSLLTCLLCYAVRLAAFQQRAYAPLDVYVWFWQGRHGVLYGKN